MNDFERLHPRAKGGQFTEKNYPADDTVGLDRYVETMENDIWGMLKEYGLDSDGAEVFFEDGIVQVSEPETEREFGIDIDGTQTMDEIKDKVATYLEDFDPDAHFSVDDHMSGFMTASQQVAMNQGIKESFTKIAKQMRGTPTEASDVDWTNAESAVAWVDEHSSQSKPEFPDFVKDPQVRTYIGSFDRTEIKVKYGEGEGDYVTAFLDGNDLEFRYGRYEKEEPEELSSADVEKLEAAVAKTYDRMEAVQGQLVAQRLERDRKIINNYALGLN